MRMLRSSQADFETAFGRIVRDRRESDVQVGRDVAAIINEVRERGDDALSDYTARFDSHGLSQDGDWQIDLEECRAAYEALDSDLPPIATIPTTSVCGSVPAGMQSTRRDSTFPVDARPILPRF